MVEKTSETKQKTHKNKKKTTGKQRQQKKNTKRVYAFKKLNK